MVLSFIQSLDEWKCVRSKQMMWMLMWSMFIHLLSLVISQILCLISYYWHLIMQLLCIIFQYHHISLKKDAHSLFLVLQSHAWFSNFYRNMEMMSMMVMMMMMIMMMTMMMMTMTMTMMMERWWWRDDDGEEMMTTKKPSKQVPSILLLHQHFQHLTTFRQQPSINCSCWI